MPTDELWSNVRTESVLDYVTAMIFPGFLAERFFVVHFQRMKSGRRKAPRPLLFQLEST